MYVERCAVVCELYPVFVEALDRLVIHVRENLPVVFVESNLVHIAFS